jgi:L,D-peptidoglycan transpeptidase YkuD (ErfK/YbiS/YcfS/YnhG family)
MTIYLINKQTLQVEDFYFKCCIGKNGLTQKKIEGDKKTPRGKFKLGHLYYKKKIAKIDTKLKLIKIKKSMGWCDDVNSNFYNKLINTNKNIRHEKLYRKDFKYDLIIPIKYNYKKPIKGLGSCIFIHLTKSYKPTAGCIALKRKDFMIMLKLINRNSRIIIL